MDRVVPGDRDSEVDLESGVRATVEELSRSPSMSENPNRVAGVCVKLEGEKVADQEKAVKENHKKKSNKKHPKPPRPPRSPSLDAADEKLIKEISKFAMLKRARIERMKVLKRTKAAKASSSSPSKCNLFAALFTIFFVLVVLFQGCCSRVSSSSPEESPASEGFTNSVLISVHYHGVQPSANSELGSLSTESIHGIVGSDPPDILRRAVGRKLKSY